MNVMTFKNFGKINAQNLPASQKYSPLLNPSVYKNPNIHFVARQKIQTNIHSNSLVKKKERKESNPLPLSLKKSFFFSRTNSTVRKA